MVQGSAPGQRGTDGTRWPTVTADLQVASSCTYKIDSRNTVCRRRVNVVLDHFSAVADTGATHWPDHPHSRGEHADITAPVITNPGSPPLARGAPGQVSPVAPACRITPARAGSTPRPPGDSGAGPDHPRSRGEHAGERAAPGAGHGSPPLARGAPTTQLFGVYGWRITPARAGSTSVSSWSVVVRSDHPRSRGEHAFIVCRAAGVSGSPPLARGARGTVVRGPVGGRITPARAGSTSGTADRRITTPDHPRSRGEHVGLPYLGGGGDGSPPLARGALGQTANAVGQIRITPARAGSTRLWTARDVFTPDHPRSRGEHVLAGAGGPSLRRITPARAGSTTTACSTTPDRPDHPRSRGEHAAHRATSAHTVGSPPLARGARPRGTCLERLRRITPARAGSTSRPQPPAASDSDHPRSRGEHYFPDLVFQLSSGSPPLARGARTAPHRPPDPGRITPARAGSTCCPPSGPGYRPDHPRSRGEHVSPLEGVTSRDGSPPLARGARRHGRGPRPGWRITPARAGSTGSPSPGRAPWTDHPRSRGEHRFSITRACSLDGSPPLARGARLATQLGRIGDRITPARAGSTRTG